MAQSAKALAAVRETRKGATIHKTNERPGTRAQVRYVRVSAYKAREVLDLIRGKHVADADEILQFVERDIAIIIRKALASAVANAVNNDSQDPETLFVSACYADEGPTLKRWRPRARGRATRIRKRTCHITIIVSRLDDTQLRIRTERENRSGRAGGGGAARAASRRERVAKSRKADEAAAAHDHDHDHDHDHEHEHEHDEPEAELVEAEATEAPATDAEVTEAEVTETEASEPEASEDAAPDADAETDEKDEN
jgi:large subunit ribosomal protein L22